MKHIRSADNAVFKSVRLLAHSARERRKQGRTVLDGLHLLESHRAAGGHPALLVLSESGLEQAAIRRFVESQPLWDGIVLSDALFAAAAPVETPTGILAVIEIPEPALQLPIAGSCVVLDNLQDSGNVGTLLRSAAAAGIGTALLTPGCAQAWSPKTLRAAMGAHFSLTLVEQAEAAILLRDYPGMIVATDGTARKSLFDADLRGPVAWLFGSEGLGLSDTLREKAVETLRIPMPGAAESLNVAAAAAICLFEQVRQRGAGGSGE